MKSLKPSASAIVIGAGVVGLFSAWRLREAGFAVTVLDAARAGQASWAAGGILSPLPPWQASSFVWQLAAESIGDYPHIADELLDATGIDIEWTQSGMTVLEAGDQDTAQRWASAHSMPLVQGVRDFGGGPQRGLHLPWVAQLRSPRLLKALRAHLQQLGVRFELAEVIGLEGEGGKVRRIRTAEDVRQAADLVVIAAGAWSSTGSLPREPATTPVRGQMLLLRGEPGVLREIVLSDSLYLIPRSDGHILAGSTLETAGFDAGTTSDARDALAAFAHRLLPQTSGMPVIRHWSGLRPSARTSKPVIARSAEWQNLYYNTGHYRVGVTLAPASASMLSRLVSV